MDELAPQLDCPSHEPAGPPLKTQVGPDGVTYYLHPAPRTLGAGVLTEAQPLQVEDDDGKDDDRHRRRVEKRPPRHGFGSSPYHSRQSARVEQA